MPPLTRVADRYRVTEPIGTGGTGTVYRATDEVTRDVVAIKFLHEFDESTRKRFEDEIALLRFLRLPGVVSMLEAGLDGEHWYLVTELVDGTPFPGAGPPVSWESIEETTIALLEGLARVHAAGVVHRDLKPANVLVRPNGRPVLLDFGIARARGDLAKRFRQGVGTPAYLSPEQALSREVTARSDLYALGVMLFEALCGRLPHESESISTLLRRRLSEPPPSLAICAPDVPPRVVVLVDRLLAISPESRPADASEALEILGVDTPWNRFPRLGAVEPLHRLVDTLRAGRTCRVAGRPGTGRTRLLREAADLLSREGRTPVWLRPSHAPYGSLPLVWRYGDPGPEEIIRNMSSALERGGVIFADDAEELDPRTQELLLDRADDELPLAWVSQTDASEADIVLRPFGRKVLSTLFHGPDRLFHLREDATDLLYRRTGGYARRVVDVATAWVRAGLGHWEGDRIRMDRTGLDRLLAGLQVASLRQRQGRVDRITTRDAELLAAIQIAGDASTRDTLATALQRTTGDIERHLSDLATRGFIAEVDEGGVALLETFAPGDEKVTHVGFDAHGLREEVTQAMPTSSLARFGHLLREGASGDLVAEAQGAVAEAIRHGRVGDAFAMAYEGCVAAQRIGDEEGRATLLAAATKAALHAHDDRRVEVALHLCRGLEAHPRVSSLRAILQLALRSQATSMTRSLLEDVRELPVFDDPDLELCAWHRRVDAARRLGMAAYARELELIEGERADVAGSASEALVNLWRGALAYARGQFDEAIALGQRAAELSPNTLTRMEAWTNVAEAAMETSRFDIVESALERSRSEWGGARHRFLEGRLTYLERSLSVRRRDEVTADPSILEAARFLTEPLEAALLISTEAILTLRRDRAAALPLAREAESLFDRAGAAAGQYGAQAILALAGADPWDGKIPHIDVEWPFLPTGVSAQCVYAGWVAAGRPADHRGVATVSWLKEALGRLRVSPVREIVDLEESYRRVAAIVGAAHPAGY